MNRWRKLLFGATGSLCGRPARRSRRRSRRHRRSPRRRRGRSSKSKCSGPSRCRIAGSSARWSASRSTRAITSSSSAIPTTSTRARRSGRAPTRRRASAAPARRRCSSTTPPARSSAIGAARATGYDWPTTPSGIAIDPKGNVWIGGSGGNDTRLLKFSHDGKFIMQVGKAVTAVASAAPAGAARLPIRHTRA